MELKDKFFDPKWETMTLYNRLRKAEINQLITYKELSSIINKESIQKQCIWYLSSARRKLEYDEQIIFEVIKNIGLRRLGNEEKIECGDIAIGKIRRAAKRGIKKLACVDFDSLKNEDKMKVVARHGALGASIMCTGKNVVKGIEDKSAKNPKFLTYMPDLSQFR